MSSCVRPSSTTIRLQFAGRVQWPWETQFLDRKMQWRWMLIELRKARKAKERANKALGKGKEKAIQRAKARILFSREKGSLQMEKGNRLNGPTIRTPGTIRALGTRVGPKASSLERQMEKVGNPLLKGKERPLVTTVDLQGILPETAR